MNIKPMFESEGYKPSDKKRTLPIIVPPVKESSLQHRTGQAIKNADGRTIGRKGEWVKMPRKTVCGMRDKMALAGSSSKVGRFIPANGHADRRMDAVVDMPNLTPPSPAPHRMKKPHYSTYRRLASSI